MKNKEAIRSIVVIQEETTTTTTATNDLSIQTVNTHTQKHFLASADNTLRERISVRLQW